MKITLKKSFTFQETSNKDKPSTTLNPKPSKPCPNILQKTNHPKLQIKAKSIPIEAKSNSFIKSEFTPQNPTFESLSPWQISIPNSQEDNQTNKIKNIKKSVQNKVEQHQSLKPIVSVVLLALLASSSIRAFSQLYKPIIKTFSSKLPQISSNSDVQIVTIVPKGGKSDLGVSWEEVMTHTAQRMKWVQDDLQMEVFTEGAENVENVKNTLRTANILVTIGVRDEQTIQVIKSIHQNVDTILSLDSSEELQELSKFGSSFRPYQKRNQLTKFFLSEEEKRGVKIFDTIQNFWMSKTSDDILYLFLVLINGYVREVRLVSGVIRDTDSDSLRCMINKCGQEIFQCVINTSCRKVLGCLGECASTDQICAYRCIASFESPQLEQFSLCILQKHNCLKNKAAIQLKPQVSAMQTFRGQTMTYELAEDIYIGWLGEEKFSWRVVAGKNPAYDYFPCQFQIFYRGKGKKTMWYDPVFKVETIDDKQVWRKRHYRVARQKTPGKFRFSVLDNGVTSLEDWTIVDCNDDLDWCLFYYSGAASAAGISYVGAIFATRTGEWPSTGDDVRINQAFEKCGIKPWELSTVNNQNCGGAPLIPFLEIS